MFVGLSDSVSRSRSVQWSCRQLAACHGAAARQALPADSVLRVTQQEIRARIAEEHASTAAAALPLPPATAATLVGHEPTQAEELRALLAPPGSDGRRAPRGSAA